MKLPFVFPVGATIFNDYNYLKLNSTSSDYVHRHNNLTCWHQLAGFRPILRGVTMLKWMASYFVMLVCFFSLQVPVLKPMDLMVEVTPRKIFANAHTYHINSISVNSDCETYMSADDLRINLWHLGITNRSFSILLLCVRAWWLLLPKLNVVEDVVLNVHRIPRDVHNYVAIKCTLM